MQVGLKNEENCSNTCIRRNRVVVLPISISIRYLANKNTRIRISGKSLFKCLNHDIIIHGNNVSLTASSAPSGRQQWNKAISSRQLRTRNATWKSNIWGHKKCHFRPEWTLPWRSYRFRPWGTVVPSVPSVSSASFVPSVPSRDLPQLDACRMFQSPGGQGGQDGQDGQNPGSPSRSWTVQWKRYPWHPGIRPGTCRERWLRAQRKGILTQWRVDMQRSTAGISHGRVGTIYRHRCVCR